MTNIIEKINKEGFMILRGTSPYNSRDYSICISSDKVAVHKKQRKCYYELYIRNYGNNSMRATLLLNKATRPIIWHRRFIQCDFIETSKLDLLVVTGRSLESWLEDSMLYLL